MTSQLQPPPAHQARALVIYCEPGTTTREAAALVDRLEEQLQAANVPALVLSYGTMSKNCTTFIAIEVYREVPGVMLDTLRADTAIQDYAVFDVPSIAQEQEAEQQALMQQAATASQAEGSQEREDAPEPPEPPTEFFLLGVPMPLLTAYDERWIARAMGAEGAGVLIYEERRKMLFLPADEAIAALAYLSEQSLHLLPHTHPELSPRHQEQIEAIRSCWMQELGGTQPGEGGPQVWA